MITIDQQREDNYQEYLRLLRDHDYVDVFFDEESGGVSAIHREHKFDKQQGPFGYKRGEYELMAVDALRQRGHIIILESELPKGENIKISDAILDYQEAEIKAIEGLGRRAIQTKIFQSVRQGANCLVLVFPERSLFSHERVIKGWQDYLENKSDTHIEMNIQIICIVERSVYIIEKPPW